MKKIIALTVILLAFAPAIAGHAQVITQPAPEWLYSNCDLPSVTVAWFNPPEDVLPFPAFFSAYLSILGNGYGETEIMTYYGSFSCPLYEGCVYHMWRSTYAMPDRDYYLSAYVLNAAHQVFNVEPARFYPRCVGSAANLYLPLVQS